MNKYFLNYLRLLTNGELPDEILKTATNIRIVNGKLKFNVKMKLNKKDWKIVKVGI